MPESQTPATELTSQYVAQVTGDLERNTKEQERIGVEIEALQEQLRALQHDHTVLVNMQQALGSASPAAEADPTAAPSVPHQASAEPKQSKPKKASAASAKKTAPKKPATEDSSVKASTAAAKPTLVELIRGHLEKQNEPRSAAEITAALTQAHPDRSVKTTVVRTTLEGLVAKSHAHRAKQGSSVFYTTVAASERL
ncbi:hypothetical protein [Streptomyces mirabilis]|uniref:hypothetical protein n=1 Tax=Streptomyces mirabilis TaxID=68239 RepID=UPI0033BCA8D3